MMLTDIENNFLLFLASYKGLIMRKRVIALLKRVAIKRGFSNKSIKSEDELIKAAQEALRSDPDIKSTERAQCLDEINKIMASSAKESILQTLRDAEEIRELRKEIMVWTRPTYNHSIYG